MKKVVKLLALVGCIASCHVSAAAKWTGDKKVTSVQVVETGGIIIYFDSTVNAACTDATTNSVYVLPNMHFMTQEGVNAIRATAFVALTTGMSVSVLYDESTSKCYGRNIVITK